MFKRFFAWQRRRQRQIDLNILWPAIRDKAPNIYKAREAFWRHTLIDDAWTDVSVADAVAIIEGLN